MTKRSLVVGCIATMSLVAAVAAQTAAPQQRPKAPTATTTASPPPRSTAGAAQAPARTQSSPAAAKPQVQLVTTAEQEKQMFTQYCYACHGDRAKAGGMDSARKMPLESLDLNDVEKDGAKWELVVRKLRAGMMPPTGMKRPDPAVFESMISYLETDLDKHAQQYMPPPGLHRLNQTEYANMVRDVLNLDVDPTKYLPTDDSTHGFDNQTAALGLSSTLVEAYVTAAQKISRLALGEPEQPTLVVYRTPEDTSQDYHIEGMPFGTRGGLLVKHTFPSDGDYTLTVTPIFGDNMSPTGFGSVPCEKLEILMDDQRLDLINWNGGGRFGQAPANCDGGRAQGAGARAANGGGPRGAAPAGRAQGAAAAPAGRGQGAGGQQAARGNGARTFNAPSGQAGPEAFFGGRGGQPMRVKFHATAGEHMLGATFLATNYAPLLDLDQHFMRDTIQTGPTPGYTFFPHVGTIRIEGPYDSTEAKDSPSRRKIFICQPKTAAEESPCARRIVSNLATHLFRRPATKSDVDGLMDFYDFGRKEGSFDSGIEMALARILASPQFIYRIEEEPAIVKPGQPYRITDTDLASRLSFFLWSTGPDDQLMKLAAENRLHEPAVLEAQVRRMLKDPKAEALAVNFAGQWLNLRGMKTQSPLPMLYPDFDDPLRQAEIKEVQMLFMDVVRNDRSIIDLLTANDTYVNERLAKHYGIPNVYGSQFRHVELPPDLDVRRGLLGKAAILTTTAKPERNSPVTRGKWIMTNILGMSPPDPPPDVPPLPPRSADPNAQEPTMREKMLMHRVRPDCVQCHRLMDPIGFSLENFDAIALWRSHDEGKPVDPKAQVYDSTEIDGPNGLRNWIVSKYSKTFVRVATEKMFTYALGRGMDWQDMPLVRAVAKNADANGDKLSALVLGVVKSKPFQMNVKVADASSPQTASNRSHTDKGNN